MHLYTYRALQDISCSSDMAKNNKRLQNKNILFEDKVLSSSDPPAMRLQKSLHRLSEIAYAENRYYQPRCHGSRQDQHDRSAMHQVPRFIVPTRGRPSSSPCAVSHSATSLRRKQALWRAMDYLEVGWPFRILADCFARKSKSEQMGLEVGRAEDMKTGCPSTLPESMKRTKAEQLGMSTTFNCPRSGGLQESPELPALRLAPTPQISRAFCNPTTPQARGLLG